MITVRDIYDLLDQKAPFSYQESWDNSGLLVGRRNQAVKRVLTTLDITYDTIQQAQEQGCELIVSHHPVIFSPIKQVTEGDYTAERVLRLAESGIAAICCHTCLDAASGGVNDVLAERCGLTQTVPLEQAGVDEQGRPYGIGRVGDLEQETTLEDYLAFLTAQLHLSGLRYSCGSGKVRRVAVGGGSCGSMMHLALAAGCDTFVTADLKYDHFLEAKALGLNVIDAGHFETENPVMERVGQWLQGAFPALEVIAAHRTPPISYR